MTTRRKLLVWSLGIGLTAIVGFTVWAVAVMVPFFSAMQERERHVQDSIYPLEHLKPEFLHNGFGVYVLTFRDGSMLTDANAGELLSLNRLPDKYDLTVIIETPSVTDASIEILSQLATVDMMMVEHSGITAEGAHDLGSRLPAGALRESNRKK